ncbi:hypothetical protein ACFQI3_10285 [Hansschlegelia quercus]|uniref:Uncharacterized protein n=1 Tax=Hansschlegelia quercus TaxID=2528245 RepID=A0A4Q9GJG3_9HYPH|nr:hypothetical protein [Hansschlegelia quercus]TBN54449.1 hypothetical protein EYR15_06360 [Hansschlegelia quercus]
MADEAVIKIDQCLFGYSDGHRLLASSIRLPADLASDLTAASDLAPGTRFASASVGYWTGFPIPTLSRYGLMHTWPAPEMPRPGCVWTHLLLLEPSLLEQVSDLSCFEALIRKPGSRDAHARYARRIELHSRPGDNRPWSDTTIEFDRNRTIELLEVLYGGVHRSVEVARPGEVDRLILELWSQQWPRLRRNFRFQTAASTGTDSTSSSFDLTLTSVRCSDDKPNAPAPKTEPWLVAAADDVMPSSSHELRTFLWRYGQDVKRQRGSFRPLVQLFIASKETKRTPSTYILASVTNAFPEIKDASTLKSDLINGALFAESQVDALLYLCEIDRGRSLPQPSDDGLARVARSWPARSTDMMRLAEWAATHPGRLADALLTTVAQVVPEADFWDVTVGFPEMRRRLAANHPDVLDSEHIAGLETESLLVLLDAIPEGHRVGGALVRRLPSPISDAVVKKAVEKFSVPVLGQAIEKANLFGAQSSEVWLSALAAAPSRVLDAKVFRRIDRTSILSTLADAMGWLSEEVVKAGLDPWAAAIRNVQEDLDTYERDELEAFLFALATIVGGQYAPQIFERSFTYLHHRMMDSYLSWRAERILNPVLPDISIFKNWDKALKLRLAVSIAYVRHDLDTSSFGRLLSDGKELKLLRKAADDVPGGHRLSKAVHSN